MSLTLTSRPRSNFESIIQMLLASHDMAPSWILSWIRNRATTSPSLHPLNKMYVNNIVKLLKRTKNTYNVRSYNKMIIKVLKVLIRRSGNIFSFCTNVVMQLRTLLMAVNKRCTLLIYFIFALINHKVHVISHENVLFI